MDLTVCDVDECQRRSVVRVNGYQSCGDQLHLDEVVDRALTGARAVIEEWESDG